MVSYCGLLALRAQNTHHGSIFFGIVAVISALLCFTILTTVLALKPWCINLRLIYSTFCNLIVGGHEYARKVKRRGMLGK